VLIRYLRQEELLCNIESIFPVSCLERGISDSYDKVVPFFHLLLGIGDVIYEARLARYPSLDLNLPVTV
jgi:hypothetical protein